MKLHGVLILFLIGGLFASARAQMPNAKAYTAMKAKDYAKVLEIYEAVFQKQRGTTGDYYNAACAASQLGRVPQAMAWLDLAYPQGKAWNFALKPTLTDRNLVAVRSSAEWPSLVARLQQRQTEFEAGPYKPLQAALLAILDDDQRDRSRMDEVEKKQGLDSPEMKALWKNVEKMDAANCGCHDARSGSVEVKQVRADRQPSQTVPQTLVFDTRLCRSDGTKPKTKWIPKVVQFRSEPA